MKDAEPVGSAFLVSEYDFGVSSATIRSEMVKLMEMGFLGKGHVSSGRVPTDIAFRHFINQISDDPGVNPQATVNIKQGIYRNRFDQEVLLRTVMKMLSSHTGNTAFINLDGLNRHYGINKILNYEELKNIESLQRIIDLLEDESLLTRITTKINDDSIAILIGEEVGIRNLEDFSVVMCKFDFWDNQSGVMGVIGPRRLNYRQVIPTVEYVREALNESLMGWN